MDKGGRGVPRPHMGPVSLDATISIGLNTQRRTDISRWKSAFGLPMTLTLEIFSTISVNMMNICGKFH